MHPGVRRVREGVAHVADGHDPLRGAAVNERNPQGWVLLEGPEDGRGQAAHIQALGAGEARESESDAHVVCRRGWEGGCSER